MPRREIRIRLAELMREYEHLHGMEEGELSYRKLAELMGEPAIHPTLNKIVNRRTKGIEFETLRKIRDFFKKELGEVITDLNEEEIERRKTRI